ncbi:YjeJ family protein [Klebsiella pneumoniae subsp. pneumoniae]|nr:YjeJ family protein [Klebsiella pneumoniae subsp. pneumoniae]
MISTVLGFNTAIIKQNDNFLALALKIKKRRQHMSDILLTVCNLK